jgi:hypothetical protein
MALNENTKDNGTGLLLYRFDAHLLHLLEKGRAVEAKKLRRLAFDAARLGEGLEDQVFFQIAYY